MLTLVCRKPNERRVETLIRELRAEREREALRQVRFGVAALDELELRVRADDSALRLDMGQIDNWLNRFDIRSIENESVSHPLDALRQVCQQLFGGNHLSKFETLRSLGFDPYAHGWQTGNERGDPLDPCPSPAELAWAWVAVVRELKGERAKIPQPYGVVAALRKQWSEFLAAE